MAAISQQKLLEVLDQQAQAIDLHHASYTSLLSQIKDTRLVLIGEASHGTQEFYAQRAALTKQLMAHHGFDAVAIEGDWPCAYAVNLWVKNLVQGSLEQALAGFNRFPNWMWRNQITHDFLTWLQAFNQQQAEAGKTNDQVGFYGLDLYSLPASIQYILDHLSTLDPQAAKKASRRYACFDIHNIDPQAYGYAVTHQLMPPCRQLVAEQLLELQQAYNQALATANLSQQEAYFSLVQNARLIKNAELYYRMMFQGTNNTWNIRDQHMVDTLVEIDQYITHQKGRPARLVVWAHNSHIGDARATAMGQRGEHNLGQLVRQKWGNQCSLIGLTTYTGSVTAASQWGQAACYQAVTPALPASYEFIMHQLAQPNFWVSLKPDSPLMEPLLALPPRLQRAIGVVYRPDTERTSHYFYTQLARQFDFLMHFDVTQALQPIDQLITSC